jgi:hypothetical protein
LNGSRSTLIFSDSARSIRVCARPDTTHGFTVRPWEAALSAIFLNYRRSDSEGDSGRLFDDLTLRFGPDAIFMDVAAIEPGRDFRKAIDKSVASCSVLLAVIGREWLEAKDAAGERRLEDPNDFVRVELASALRRDIPVVPVLVRGAKMPRVDQLPDDLKELAYRNAVELAYTRWKTDVQALVQALRPYLDANCPSPSAVNGAAQALPANQPAEHMPDAAPAESAIDQETLNRVSRELAVYIGPISELVAKRTAKQCTSLEEFFLTLAEEIESEPDRLKFLKSCRG